MSDPFSTNSRSQLMREAQVGLSLVAILLVLFVYVAYYRMTGQGGEIPLNVQSAPVAESVWPYEYASSGVQQSQSPKVVESVASKLKSAQRTAEVDDLKVGFSSRTNLASHSKQMSRPKLHAQQVAHSSQNVSSPKKEAAKKEIAIAPRVQKSEASLPKQDTTRLNSAGSPKHLARGLDRAIQSRVVDDPFLQTAKVVSSSSVSSQANTGNKPTQSRMIAKSSNSFVPPKPPEIRIPHKASINPEMQPPKPIFDKVVTSDEREPRFRSDVVRANQLRSLSNSTEIVFNEDKPDISNDFASANFAPTGAADEEPDSNEFGFEPQADFDETNNSNPPEFNPLTSRKNQLVGFDQSAQPPSENLDLLLDSLQPTTRQSSIPADSSRHKVVRGDSFWTIAQQRYGDGRFFRSLYKYNEQNVTDFENLVPGTLVDTPSRKVLIQLWPDLCPNSEIHPAPNGKFRSYVTRDGDTLFEIAGQTLGQASRYLEILELNSPRLSGPVNHLTPLKAGIYLVLPATASR